MKLRCGPFLCVVVLIASSSVQGQHADLKPDVFGGRIVTDGWIDATSTLIPGLRVFGYDFQEDPLDPYFASDPGFNTAGGSNLPAGSQLRFNFLDATQFGLSSNLSYWNGVGTVSFGTPPTAETLRLNLGGQNRTAGAAIGEIAGFSLATAGANGSVHVHINSFLQGSDGNSDPADGNNPANGVYLLPLELASSEIALADSLPLFLVYNNGLDEAAHDAAIEWVETNLVPIPEPATIRFLFVATAVSVLCLRRCARLRCHHGRSTAGQSA
jgi:hypothetical protein